VILDMGSRALTIAVTAAAAAAATAAVAYPFFSPAMA
jgi:hypothetical protein